MPIGAFVSFTAKPGSEQELLERMTDTIADVRTEPGNLMAVVLRDPDQPGKVFLFQIYKDQAAIEAHRIAAHSVEKGPAVRALFTEQETKKFETVDWPETQKVP